MVHKYFALCLEEFQLYKAGRIPEQTWRYWVSGMHHYLQFSAIEQYWRKMELGDTCRKNPMEQTNQNAHQIT